ncbi:hypothetical protein [Dysgonomonas macrotermitis]|uniref:Uncharacterized protein n=1 Tax=Dysgonomonas macrotermitis TaxID=1346286 RepID=A0A1M5DD98_9BACT|nr:hypothetical protein [Dysgonomonas macrotermitis]SHF64814.1 hypothetical protein SAMN05444362_108154 [Dysgonomonas macrotermitis]
MLKDNYNRSVQLECATCGGQDFESNDDKTYIKCNTCDREYLGGYDELVEYNQGKINQTVDDVKHEVRDDIEQAFKDMFKKFK